MQVSKRVKVDFVQYRGGGQVLVNVIPQLVDENEEVVGSSPVENVVTDQETLTGYAKEADRAVWGDDEIDRAIRSASRSVTRTEPIPADEQDANGPTERSVTVEVLRFPGWPVVW